MNVMICSLSNYVRNSFVDALIPQGIEVYHAEHIDHILDKLEEHAIDILILDVIHSSIGAVINFIGIVRQHSSDAIKKIAIMLIVGTIEKKDIITAVKAGAAGFVRGNASKEEIAAHVIQTYQKIKGVPPERKFVRVILDPSDPRQKIMVKFRSPLNDFIYMGTIKDISFGGIAVELTGTYDPSGIVPDMGLKNIQFIIDQKDIIVDGRVVAFRNSICAIRFNAMPEQEGETVSQFIFERLSSGKEPEKEKPAV